MDETAIAFIGTDFINAHTDFPVLIEKLHRAFAANDVDVPTRHHHNFKNAVAGADSTLLLMPAWLSGQDAGVKIVTVCPENGQYGLPAIQGTYIYLDAATGSVKAILDAKALTAKRTAAVSAMASSFLSRKNASSLLMIGTGALSANLIAAHASVRPIEQVFVWGLNFDKATAIAAGFNGVPFSVKAVRSIEDAIGKVDIISCATLSKTPLVMGRHLVNGQHVDLIGSYKKDMREADDETILKSSIFVDSYYGALNETGDIYIPIQNGIISTDSLKADLFELCAATKPGRAGDREITLFKSVGHSLEDLIAARYYYDQYKFASQ
jgi:ornithine cyclodeaminase